MKGSTQSGSWDGQESLVTGLLTPFWPLEIHTFSTDWIVSAVLQIKYKMWTRELYWTLPCENRDSSAVTLKGRELKLAQTWQQEIEQLNGDGRRRGCLFALVVHKKNILYRELWILNAGCKKTSSKQLPRAHFFRALPDYASYFLKSRKKYSWECWASKLINCMTT